jgi:hypothetical protein
MTTGEEAIEADVGDGIQETQAGARGVAQCAHIQLHPVANLLDLGENQFNLIFPLVMAKVVFKVFSRTCYSTYFIKQNKGVFVTNRVNLR